MKLKLDDLRNVVGAVARSRRSARRATWSRDRLLAFQRQRLGALVEHACEHSPFHRAHYGGKIPAADVRLEDLPPIAKQVMMEQFDRFVTDPRLRLAELERHVARLTGDELHLGRYRVLASSGSSGKRGIYVYDRDEWTTVLAGLFRWMDLLEIAPRIPRRRIAAIGAPDGKHMTYRMATAVDIGAHRTLRLEATRSTDDLVQSLNAFQPEALHAYPSVASVLADAQLDGRLSIAPRVVCTSSEVRTEAMTRRIREAWGVDPFDCLGLTETGIAAADCREHRGLHVFEDQCILEGVDEHGRPVPPGQPSAKVYATNLYNYTQPLIRIEISDMLSFSDAPCACGRTLRRITSLDGRSDDVLELPGVDRAVRIHPVQMHGFVTRVAGVGEYQIIQDGTGLELRVVPARGARGESVSRELTLAIRRELGALGVSQLPIQIRLVPRLDREPGPGKLKLIKAIRA